MRGLRLGLGLGGGGGEAPAFSVSFTGLSSDSLGNYGQIGNHAAISYTITPDNGTETVKWSNSSNPADAATFGTGANPTTFASVDGFSVYLHVTDGAETRTFSFSARYAPGTFGALSNQTFAINTGDQTYVFDAATGTGLTWTYALASPPSGVTIVSATRTITHDTDTLALQTGTVITVTATDQYGRSATGSPRTYELEIANTPVLSAFGSGSIDDLELDPPAIFIEHNISGTLTGDFHASATPPAKGAGDIGTFTTSLTGDAVTDISTALNTFLNLHPGETGYLHFRLTASAVDSNVITTQQITVPAQVPNAFVDANWSVATGSGSGELDVTIATLPANNGATITDVEYDLDASGSWVSSGGTTSFTISGLTASTSYAVRLRAVNSVGNGAAGNSESATSGAAAANLITNGTFDTDTDWTKIGTATISGGTGNLNAGGDSLTQAYAFTTGVQYNVAFDIVTLSADGVAVLLKDFAAPGATTFNTTGSKSVTLTAGSWLDIIRFEKSGTGTATIDNVVVTVA